MDRFHVWNLVHVLAGLTAGWTKSLILVLCTHKCKVKAARQNTTAGLTQLSSESILTVRYCLKCQPGCRTKATKIMEPLNRGYILCTGFLNTASACPYAVSFGCLHLINVCVCIYTYKKNLYVCICIHVRYIYVSSKTVAFWYCYQVKW